MPERGGLITGLVVGVAALVISVIIAFIIVSTIADVESDTASGIGIYTVNNETASATGVVASLNDTEYTLADAGIGGFTNPTIIRLYNVSLGAIVEINIGNASVTGAGVLTNGTAISGGWQNISVSYSYQKKLTEVSTRDLRYNFTAGIGNVSEQIPTILLIAAVVLILGILALLWNQYVGMRVGAEGGGL